MASNKTSWESYLGGPPFALTAKVGSNGISLTIKEAIIDSGAAAHILISEKTAAKLIQCLKPEVNHQFKPVYIGGPFSGDESKKITRAINANVTLQHRTAYNEWLVVADIHHDMIIGRLWFEHHDAGIDCHRRRLLFDDSWSKDPNWIQNIHVEYRNTKPEPSHQADAERRSLDGKG